MPSDLACWCGVQAAVLATEAVSSDVGVCLDDLGDGSKVARGEGLEGHGGAVEAPVGASVQEAA